MRNPKLDVTYLDHNASSPVPEFLLRELGEIAQRCLGNPSSLHTVGRQSRRVLNDTTASLAKMLDCQPEQIFWTSGASEANSWALFSSQAQDRQNLHKRILISSLEHESIQASARHFGENGTRVDYIRALSNGQIDLAHLRALLDDGTGTDLVSILHSSNETGVLQPIDEISDLCRKANVALHVDCVSSLLKCPISVRRLNAQYTTFSGHKIGALKGLGVLVASQPNELRPMIRGKQQRARRGGTENTFGVATLGHLLENIRQGFEPFPEQLAVWHREFEAELKRRIPGTVIHGEASPRLRNTTFVGFEAFDSDSLLAGLDLAGICASSGAACAAGTVEPSPTLLAMGSPKAMARSSVRFSSGAATQSREFERVLDILPSLVERARSRS